MKTRRLSLRLGFVVGATIVLAAFLVSSAVAFPNQYKAWNKYYQNSYFKFWYKSTDSYGRNIAHQLSISSEWGYNPFDAARKVLGQDKYKLSGLFDVLIDPNSSYNSGGYSGHFWYTTGSTAGLKGQYIYMSAGRTITEKNMYTWGSVFAHELSHMIYMNYTKGYTRTWWWDSSSNGYRRDRALTESLAYYTGSCYYLKDTSYKLTDATIKKNVKGYVELVEYAAYRYIDTGFTSKDWYLFHAFGYYLANTGKVKTLINSLQSYISKGSSYAFLGAYQNTFKKSWADWIPASTQKSNSSYLYYGFYVAWIK